MMIKTMQNLISKLLIQKKDAGFALPAALFLTFLCTTVLVAMLNRSSTADQEKYLRLQKLDASNLSRMGLESNIAKIRKVTAGPTSFPTWTALTANAEETYDAKVCGIASQFSSSAISRMSPRYVYKNYAMRYYAITEVDNAAGSTAFPNQWRIISCVISTSKPYFAKSRSALIRYAIQDNGTSIDNGTVIDIRDY